MMGLQISLVIRLLKPWIVESHLEFRGRGIQDMARYDGSMEWIVSSIHLSLGAKFISSTHLIHCLKTAAFYHVQSLIHYQPAFHPAAHLILLSFNRAAHPHPFTKIRTFRNGVLFHFFSIPNQRWYWEICEEGFPSFSPNQPTSTWGLLSQILWRRPRDAQLCVWCTLSHLEPHLNPFISSEKRILSSCSTSGFQFSKSTTFSYHAHHTLSLTSLSHAMIHSHQILCHSEQRFKRGFISRFDPSILSISYPPQKNIDIIFSLFNSLTHKWTSLNKWMESQMKECAPSEIKFHSLSCATLFNTIDSFANWWGLMLAI